jgi:diphthamide synthase (EF-2-diphthine--ammonia ligase)
VVALHRGRALNQDLHYAETREDEVESLYTLLKEVKRRCIHNWLCDLLFCALVALLNACLMAMAMVMIRFPNVRGVASGAILSDYQRFRVENVYARAS